LSTKIDLNQAKIDLNQGLKILHYFGIFSSVFEKKMKKQQLMENNVARKKTEKF